MGNLFHIHDLSSLIESDFLRFVELKGKQLLIAWLKGTFHHQKPDSIHLNTTMSNKRNSSTVQKQKRSAI